MTDPREANLPKWAQELLKQLRTQIGTALEPAVFARRKLAEVERRLRDRDAVICSLHELLFTAAKGGHRTAQEIVGVLQSYEIFPPTTEGAGHDDGRLPGHAGGPGLTASAADSGEHPGSTGRAEAGASGSGRTADGV